MQCVLLTLAFVTVVQCHILANGDPLEVHTVLGGAVTVKLEYPPVGRPIPNCCSNAKILQQPVLAGAVVTEVAHLRDRGYLLRLDFVENIVTCHLVPDVGETNNLSSTLCPLLVCPAGWNLLQDTCFLLTQVSGSWEEGQTFCQQQGGTLATISSNFQHVALSGMLTDDTWIGLRYRHSNHTYGWIDDSEHTYTSWAQKERSISDTPNREECVEMREGHAFLWDAAPCNQSKLYLCSVPGTADPGQTNSHSKTTTPTTLPTTTITTTTQILECKTSWSKYKSSCYKEFKNTVNITEATVNCRAQGAYLVKISSEDENSFVAGLVTLVSFIGLSDEKKEGFYTWQDDTPLSYSKWRTGEPNNVDGFENCVVMHKNSTWIDISCGNQHYYICEDSNE